MRKMLLLLMICNLLYTGCSTTRLTTSNNVTDELVDLDLITETEKVNYLSSTNQLEVEKVASVVIDEFDTDKPIDPSTGVPPLKKRTTTNTQIKKAENNTADSKGIQIASTQLEAVQKKNNQQQKEDSLNKEISTGVWGWLKIGCAIGGMLVFALYALCKKYKII